MQTPELLSFNSLYAFASPFSTPTVAPARRLPTIRGEPPELLARAHIGVGPERIYRTPMRTRRAPSQSSRPVNRDARDRWCDHIGLFLRRRREPPSRTPAVRGPAWLAGRSPGVTRVHRPRRGGSSLARGPRVWSTCRRRRCGRLCLVGFELGEVRG